MLTHQPYSCLDRGEFWEGDKERMESQEDEEAAEIGAKAGDEEQMVEGNPH